ncbi:MAG: type I polyketide synthase, partial [Methyloligellaceae bacterium]
IQTACSTSLVAIHVACQGLLNRECDMALAGGVTIILPQKQGYLYQQEGIASPDGYCRAFDAKAQGTVCGNGVGIVVLKRLAEALEDGDYIHAVIKGSAINNDGAAKVGYTAPSIEGQAGVIADALAMAGVDAETIGYIEAHGTGTELGDPIEVRALAKAFRLSTDKKGFCALGAVKSNIGHLNCAAGVAGFIKTVLALEHKALPPSLHFETPNPKIEFAGSPFYVNHTLADWPDRGLPRRAGVSSFGIGGTNAHVVLEEAVASCKSQVASGQVAGGHEHSSRSHEILLLSAKTESALETATANLAAHLQAHPEQDLADVAWTLQVGRKAFAHRRALVCSSREEAIVALESLDRKRVRTAFQPPTNRPIAFMFTGQGAQYVDMAKELYEVEPMFREQVDACCEILRPVLGFDLREVVYPELFDAERRERRSHAEHGNESKHGQETMLDPQCSHTELGNESEPRSHTVSDSVLPTAEKLKQTAITQPALFVIEYALAQLWMGWGIKPKAMIGHSIGEYVAACLAGVFSLEDALALVAARGKLMHSMPAGAMLAVSVPESEVAYLLNENLSVAAINGPALCVVSGPTEEVDKLESDLAKSSISSRRLHTSHAFHSAMMDEILSPFTDEVKKIALSAPKIPFISNVTGGWIKDSEATDSNYWARHLRSTVRFADGVPRCAGLQEPSRILLEIGPGQTLCTLARVCLQETHKQAQNAHPEPAIVSSLRRPQEKQSDVAFLLTALARLWLAGVRVDWARFHANEKRARVP